MENQNQPGYQERQPISARNVAQPTGSFANSQGVPGAPGVARNQHLNAAEVQRNAQYPAQNPTASNLGGPGVKSFRNQHSELEVMSSGVSTQSRIAYSQSSVAQDRLAPNSQRSMNQNQEAPIQGGAVSQRSRPAEQPKHIQQGPQASQSGRLSQDHQQTQFYQSEWPAEQYQDHQEQMSQGSGFNHRYDETYSQNSGDHQYNHNQDQVRPTEMNRNRHQSDQEYKQATEMSFSSQKRPVHRGPAENHPGRYGQNLDYSPDSLGRSSKPPKGAMDSSGSSRVGSEDVGSQSISFSRKQSEVCRPGESGYLDGLEHSTASQLHQDPRFEAYQSDEFSREAQDHQTGGITYNHEIQAQQSRMMHDHQKRSSTQISHHTHLAGGSRPLAPSTFKHQANQFQTDVQDSTPGKQTATNLDRQLELQREHFPTLEASQYQMGSDSHHHSSYKAAVPAPPRNYQPQFCLIRPDEKEPGMPACPSVPELHPLGVLKEGERLEAFLATERSLQGSSFRSYLVSQHLANTYYLNPQQSKQAWSIFGANTNALRQEMETREIKRALAQTPPGGFGVGKREPTVELVSQVFADVEQIRQERRIFAQNHHEQLRQQTYSFLEETQPDLAKKEIPGLYCISKPALSRPPVSNEGDKSRDRKTISTSYSQGEANQDQKEF